MKRNVILFIAEMLGLSPCGILAAQQPKPNLVFIFDDQHSYDMLGCYGNKQVKTPMLDKFAKQGVRFENSFSNCPVSTPFRGMLMSGQYSLLNGTIKNDFPLLPSNGKKFAEVLRDEGYKTAYIGKWHILGGDRDRPIPQGRMRYGFDDLFLSNNCTVDYRPNYCFYWDKNGQKQYFDTWEIDGQTDQALNYLDEQKDSRQPFAMFVSWHAPHNNSELTDDNEKKHYTYSYVSDDLKLLYNEDSIIVRPGTSNTPEIRKMYRDHMAMISAVDRSFGKLMDKLKELGLDKNTLVVFTSDHGDMLEFKDYYGSKSVAYDYSDHTPLIMRWPEKLQENKSSKLLISALDLMPSILGLMSLPVPKECQGKRLSKAILQNDENVVKFIPIWNIAGTGYRGVITKDYVFCRQKKDSKASFQNLLIDRKTDPYQLKNQFDNPKMTATKKKLWDITQCWMKDIGDKFWEWKDVNAVMSMKEWEYNTKNRPIDLLNKIKKP